MRRDEVLETAGRLIGKDRAQVYGDAQESFEAIAAMWTAYLKNHATDVALHPLQAADVAAMMVLMKVSRLRCALDHGDTWVDIAGYGALGGEIAAASARTCHAVP